MEKNKLPLVFLIFLYSIMFAQNNVTSQKEPWIDIWQEATVSIGIIVKVPAEDKSNGKKIMIDCFKPIGTGVLFYSPNDKSDVPWLVTAKHVLFSPSNNPDYNWDPDSVFIRFSWFSSYPIWENFGLPIRLKKANNEHAWIAHPNESIDLAALPLFISRSAAGKDAVAVLPFGAFAIADEIFEGAPVLVLGYPASIGIQYWNKALLRSGVVAWVDPEDPLKNRLIIDCMVFPGNSGGPVFKLPTGIDKYGNFKIGGKVTFLGIVSEGRKQIEETVEIRKNKLRLDGEDSTITASQQWIGVGIIEPAFRVQELLKHVSIE